MMEYNNPNDFWRPGEPDVYKDCSDEERVAATICHIVCMCLAFFIMLAFCAMCSSCTTTQYVPVPEYHTDTLIVNKVQKDSIWVHDSVSVKEKGDTVWIEKWHTKYALKEVHDTTYVSKTDTVPVPYPVEKEVPAELTWWQKTQMYAGDVLLVIVLASLLYFFVLRRR